MLNFLRRLFGSKPKPKPVPPVVIQPVDMLLPRQRGVPVPATLFGMHYVKVWLAQLPAVPYGFYRLLDATPRWHHIHTADGAWADDAQAGTGISRIDSVLWSHKLKGGGQPVLYTLAGGDMTDGHWGFPAFLRDAARSTILTQWREYVTMMAERFKGQITHWELWNEPDMWLDDVELLVELARNAHNILRRTDPSNVVLTPAFTTLEYMERYLRTGGYQWADALATHMDGRPQPEGFDVTHIRAVEQLRQQYMPGKAHWITEGHSRGTGDRAHDAGIVMRAYLNYWITGVECYSWYSWDFGSYPDFADVDWVTLADDNGNARPAAEGYARIYGWLVGRSMQSALRDDTGSWTVLLDNGQRIRWNENSTGEPTLS
jgi:hypothetical protein